MQFSVRTGPFFTLLSTSLRGFAGVVEHFYCDNLVAPEDGFYDFHICVDRPRNLRRWFRPQALFLVDGKAPFRPLPLAQAYPFFEWGLNWCISHQVHRFLILHAAAIERDGYAVIMPGAPGNGKSTLCAALIHRGWRLLSDELSLIAPENGLLTALARPVGLKNQSIEVIQRFAPEAGFGPLIRDTKKGTVTYMRPTGESLQRVMEKAEPKWLIFPRYQEGAGCQLMKREKCSAFMEAAKQGFNYSLLGSTAFRTLRHLVEQCACFDFKYSRLDEAVRIFDNLPGLRGSR